MTTTTTSAATWLPVSSGWPRPLRIFQCSQGVGTVGISPARTPIHTGMKKPSAPKPWATPTVTTERMSRGDFENRRMTSRSVMAPNSAPPNSAIGMTARKLTPWATSRSSAAMAGTAPTAAAAKLMMRLVR